MIYTITYPMLINPGLNQKSIQEFAFYWFIGFNQRSIPSTCFLDWSNKWPFLNQAFRKSIGPFFWIINLQYFLIVELQHCKIAALENCKIAALLLPLLFPSSSHTDPGLFPLEWVKYRLTWVLDLEKIWSPLRQK